MSLNVPAVICAALFAVSCSDDSAIVGDWFQSTNGCPDCIQANGYRFRSDGTWSRLRRAYTEIAVNPDLTRKAELKNEYHCIDSYEKQTYEWSGRTLSLFCEKRVATEVARRPDGTTIRRPDGTVERTPVDAEAGLCHYFGGGVWELKESEKEGFRFRIEGETAEVGHNLSFRSPAAIGTNSSTLPTTFKRATGLTYLGPVDGVQDLQLPPACEQS